MFVQDCVSGLACCVNKPHHNSRLIVILVHTTGTTWYKVLYKHNMYVISLSNISIKTNFKQITRVEIRLTNLYNTLRETTFCARCHVYLLLFILLLCYRCSHLRVLPRITIIWRHDKIVRQRRSRATSRHSFITTVWWYNILYQTTCIRQATFFKFKGKRTKCLIKRVINTINNIHQGRTLNNTMRSTYYNFSRHW